MALRTLACLGPVFLLAPPDETELRLKLGKGDKLRFEFSDRHETLIENPTTGDIKVTFELLLHWDAQATAVDAGGAATLKATIMRLRVALQNAAYGGMDLDTDAEGGGAGRLAALRGKPFTLVIAANGTVKKVTGLAPLVEAIAKQAPEVPAGRKVLEMELSDAAVQAKLQECLGPLPKEKKAAGASWPASFAARLPLTGNELTASPSCKLEKVEGGKATVRVSGASKSQGGRATMWDEEGGGGSGGGGRGRGGGGGPGGGLGGGMGDMVGRVLRNTHVEWKQGEFTGSRELDLATGTPAKGEATWKSEVGLAVKIPAGFGPGGGGDTTLPGKIEQKRTLVVTRPGKG
ncbi:MAG: DUF6263 family protein [Planctomycetales bacterium]|nr:DUF6263 family protein [Planctomycetales bacterium]